MRTYLELFAERFARERLAAVARAQADVPAGLPEVLFVCVHNAGRSQMAAGLLDHRANGTVHVRSAGSDRLEVNVAEHATLATGVAGQVAPGDSRGKCIGLASRATQLLGRAKQPRRQVAVGLHRRPE